MEGENGGDLREDLAVALGFEEELELLEVVGADCLDDQGEELLDLDVVDIKRYRFSSSK